MVTVRRRWVYNHVLCCVTLLCSVSNVQWNKETVTSVDARRRMQRFKGLDKRDRRSQKCLGFPPP